MTRAWCRVLFKLRSESQLRVGSSAETADADDAESRSGDGKASYISEAALTHVRMLEHVQTAIDRKNFGRPASMD